MITKMRFVAVACLLVAGCTDWRDSVKPGLAIRSPEQTPVTATPTHLRFGETDATLTARAHYRTKAWVVAVDDGFDDGFGDVMAIDTALAWGPLGNPDILKTMSFHLARRYVSVRWTGEMPLNKQVVMTHLSNHHLIPSNDEVRATLDGVKEGDLLELDGHLVDVTIGAQTRRTSLTRSDKGDGACEILYVERAVMN